MKPLRVESQKSFDHGFLLNEIELRRIVDLVREQTKKIPDLSQIREKYIIKFKNGAIAESDSIDSVLEQENSGSGLIIRLRIELVGVTGQGEWVSSLEFINVDADEESGYTSIHFAVSGQDRDWVFVSSSQIKERIDKIKRFSFNRFGSKGGSRIFYRLFTPVFILVFMLIILLLTAKNERDEFIGSKAPSHQFQEYLKQNNVTDPIMAMVKLEEIREERNFRNVFDIFPFRIIGYMVGFLIL